MMLHLPKKIPLPCEIKGMISSENCKVIMEVPHRSGKRISFTPYSILLFDESILLPLEQERTEAGEAMVNALWFEKEVHLYLSLAQRRLCLSLRPYRCYAAGALFSQTLTQLRKENSRADIAILWELWPERWEETDDDLPPSQPLALTGEADCHLDILTVPYAE